MRVYTCDLSSPSYSQQPWFVFGTLCGQIDCLWLKLFVSLASSIWLFAAFLFPSQEVLPTYHLMLHVCSEKIRQSCAQISADKTANLANMISRNFEFVVCIVRIHVVWGLWVYKGMEEILDDAEFHIAWQIAHRWLVSRVSFTWNAFNSEATVITFNLFLEALPALSSSI